MSQGPPLGQPGGWPPPSGPSAPGYPAYGPPQGVPYPVDGTFAGQAYEFGGGGYLPAKRRGAWVWKILAALVVLVTLAGVVATFVQVPYVIMRPGPAVNVLGTVPGSDDEVITIKGHQSYPQTGTGSLRFTTVTISGGPGRPVSALDWLTAKLQGHIVVPVEEVYPENVTQQQIDQESKAEMKGSQDDAKATAIRAIGLNVPEKIFVAGVATTGPSNGKLKPDDVFVSINGKPVTSSSVLRAEVAKVPAGESLSMVVKRGTVEVPVTITPVTQNGRRLLGIGLDWSYTFPIDVTIEAGNVGGPSAGMMFSLGIYDELTPGDLTGGKQVAGTGTVDDSGNVGPIGGIQEKLVGARNAGADYFLAPAADCPEVVGNVPDGLTVTRVSTFAEAKHALEEIAAGRGNRLPVCSESAP